MFSRLFRVNLITRSVPAPRRLSHPGCRHLQTVRFPEKFLNYRSNQLVAHPFHTQSVRWKSNKKGSRSAVEQDDDSDIEEDEEDFKDEQDAKIVKSNVKSLRLDLIVKSGLGLARNKVETIFYDNKIRVNGQKIGKKSVQVDVGDEIDIFKEFSPSNPGHLQIARVQLLAANEKEEGYRVIMRRFKSLIVENYSGQNAFKSGS